ncbi:lysophospholipid acyltransferase family protein [Blastochloris viridis]|uniref:1-acyl-sn-glycerol-3-phosphate acyltransferase n=1 Tax=Blastochloris viridis TaxID=1079 RepID=A0A182D044_BLAVI|nr:lysophospholipid acyltransferase family protein [Blastochloris viridis]ALK07979.1 1-acyl-sn-glycerol-3-phosphate acyltransferase [Blastochloris viridis]BAR98764.1 1-acyl-sn-glycerol-3-phosphate acyltransferase [Blastochloris viridis]
MVILRSILFNVLFYLNLAVQAILYLPLLALSRRHVIRATQYWGRSTNWLLGVVAGIRIEFRGLENLPPGPLLIASKHQSAWETFGLVGVLADPVFVYKRELGWLPLYGWYCKRAGMIAVDRSGGAVALRRMSEEARAAIAFGRQIIIFPEGTRRPVGAEPDYKPGIGLLYGQLKVPCVPVALNSGLFWRRRTFRRFPGTIIAEFLPPIPPGLPRAQFMARLQNDIETATDRLVAEGRKQG